MELARAMAWSSWLAAAPAPEEETGVKMGIRMPFVSVSPPASVALVPGELPQPHRPMVHQTTRYGAASLLMEEPEGERPRSSCCL